jgi:thioredoxin-dependent peroxiredoxin
MTPTAGQPAPDFSLADDTGATVHLADLRGHRVVLYFYPKDDTPGCTRQACAIRDGWGDLEATGARLFGVSPDSVESHARFRDKFHLPFPLLADEDRSVLEAYGFWGERANGSVGVIRSTVLVGEDGTIEHVWSPVDPDEHLDIIREALAA